MANKTLKTVRRLSAGRKAALALVAPSAFESGKAEDVLALNYRAAGGHQDHVKREALAGRIAYGFSKRGDNRPMAELITYGYAILDKKGINTNDAKRRTKVEHDVWNASTTWLTGFLSRHGIVSTAKNAGNKNAAGKSRKPRPGTAKDEKSALGLAPKQASPAFKTVEDLVTFVEQQSAMLLACLNKNAKIASMSSGTQSAVQDFRAAMKPIAAAMNTNTRVIARLRKAQA